MHVLASFLRWICALFIVNGTCGSSAFEEERTVRSDNVIVCPAMKSVQKLLPKTRPHWVGNGFHVYPTFANDAFTKSISPFLMLDYAQPKIFEPNSGSPRGVGQHPHRGFETVTIAYEGEVEHADSIGNRGVIGSGGEVQWMTAGRGIIHEEFHSKKFSARGGKFEMVQLWVNLPKKHKMTAPRYQGLTLDMIPDLRTSTGRVRVIAGEYEGTKGPAKTFTPITVLDVTLDGVTDPWIFDVEEGHNTIVLVRKGGVSVAGKTEIAGQQCALLGTTGTKVSLQATSPGTKVLFLSGETIDEPIANRGPFVMNTQQELQQAMRDFHSGNFGQ